MVFILFFVFGGLHGLGVGCVSCALGWVGEFEVGGEGVVAFGAVPVLGGHVGCLWLFPHLGDGWSGGFDASSFLFCCELS